MLRPDLPSSQMKVKGPIQVTLQGKLNKGLLLMEGVVLNASRENSNQAPFMGSGRVSRATSLKAQICPL